MMQLMIRNTHNTAILVLFTPSFYKWVKQIYLSAPFVCALLGSTEATASFNENGNTTRCGNSELSLTVPVEWELTDNQFAAVQCAFRGPGSGYPNVNVIREPLNQGLTGLPVDRRVADIIQSYKAIGLTDAIATKQEVLHIGGVEVLEVTIDYTSLERLMKAVVAVFSREDRLFTMTILDHQRAFRLSESTARGIVRSISFREAPPPLPATGTATAPPPASNGRAVAIIVVGFAVAVAAFLALIRLRSR